MTADIEALATQLVQQAPELDPDRATHLADHLRGCSPCMERAEFQARLKELVRRKCHADPPAHLVVRIRSIIRRDRFDRA